MMNYRSYHDMGIDVWNYLPRLPVAYDLIVGVPQSGIVPAAMLASYLKVRLSSLDLFVEGRCMTPGITRAQGSANVGLDGVSRVLVIDDTTCYGHAMREARVRVAASSALAGRNLLVHYAAVYARHELDDSVDFAFSELPRPRAFQWNIFNHPAVTEKSCFDIDGVVCADPTCEENDDGPRYHAFLKSAHLKLPVKFKVGCFVTSRLEKYRTETEQWLREHGFEWSELVMMNLSTKEDRIRFGHAAFKASVYGQRAETLFFESSWKQAVEIARLTGKPVFCTETMSMVPAVRSEVEGMAADTQQPGRLQSLYADLFAGEAKIDALRVSNDVLKSEAAGLNDENARMTVAMAEQSAKIDRLVAIKSEQSAKIDALRASRMSLRGRISVMTKRRSRLLNLLRRRRAARASGFWGLVYCGVRAVKRIVSRI